MTHKTHQKNKDKKQEDIISLCKRRGFIYQGSEIYGGLAGTWDYAPLGLKLKKNIEQAWRKRFVEKYENIYEIDAAILMNQKVWKASGHVDGFTDPLVEDVKTHKRYRADHIIEEAGFSCIGLSIEDMNKIIKDNNIKSPDKNDLGEVRKFNMMLKTSLGAIEDENSITYLRPETAGGMFVNFKNILDTFHPKIPFGMAQIGKAFRNEIAPRDFIFRVREFEQMEIEYFVHPDSWKESYDFFDKEMSDFLINDIGLNNESLHRIEIAPEDRAHYSKHSVDREFEFVFGQKELAGLAYRTDFDLKAHTTSSKVDLTYFDEENKTRYTPHVIEPTFGLGRLLLATITDAYTVDKIDNEDRVYLNLNKNIAPYTVAIFPLLKNKIELTDKAKNIYQELKKHIPTKVVYDETGSIGKRYRKQDEIGTPFCVTVDFDTLENDYVTIRNRNTGEQEKINVNDLPSYLEKVNI